MRDQDVAPWRAMERRRHASSCGIRAVMPSHACAASTSVLHAHVRTSWNQRHRHRRPSLQTRCIRSGIPRSSMTTHLAWRARPRLRELSSPEQRHSLSTPA